MKKLNMQTANLADKKYRELVKLFPNAISEAINENGEIVRCIDKDVLMQEINTRVVEGREERYQFTWPDKRKAIIAANAPSNCTLRPCRKESVDFDTTQNLYIEGDNLEVLKLLQENYLGKVKMIYIDPPYNTGNDFVYEDDLAETTEEFKPRSFVYDEDGNQVVSADEKNTLTNGRFHTDWLNMIYPRLKLARNLLSDDGVIFISIDDNEVENLRKVCDEVFGESLSLGDVIVISNPGGRDYKQIAVMHEHLLIYAKSQQSVLYQITKDAVFEMKDDKGGYELRELRNRNPKFNRANRPNLFYTFFVNPNLKDEYGCCHVSLNKDEHHTIEVSPYNSEGCESVWRWGKVKSTDNISAQITSCNIVARQKRDGGWNIYEKCRKITTKAKSLWNETEMRTEDGTRLIRSLFGASYFDHPKPLALLYRCCQLATDDDSLILDFFSGSATTAHAVMQLNSEDGGKRRFIMVQLPEETAEGSEARKAGYKNICEIGKERIRRSGKKIIENAEFRMQNAELFDEEGNAAKPNSALDVGFRVLKLDSSNMQDVYYTPEEFLKQDMLNFNYDNIKPDRTAEDLLFQVMLELGVPLSAKIERREMAGAEVWSVENGYLLACFDKDIKETVITAIAKQKPYYFVMRDMSLADDSVAVNFEQLFKSYSPDTTLKVL